MAPNIAVTLVLLIGLFERCSSATATYNVVSFGARGDGKTDSTKAFLRAWSAACSTSVRGAATVYVPRGSFLIKPVVFSGPCRSSGVTFQMDDTGTSLVAPSNYWELGNSGTWILFIKVTGLSVYGGTVDARGHAYWHCKRYGKSCTAGARVHVYIYIYIVHGHTHIIYKLCLVQPNIYNIYIFIYAVSIVVLV